jgi:hypothetical protein
VYAGHSPAAAWRPVGAWWGRPPVAGPLGVPGGGGGAQSGGGAGGVAEGRGLRRMAAAAGHPSSLLSRGA